MNKKVIKKVIKDIKSHEYFEGDLSDIGNDIGVIVGKYLKNSDEIGDLDDLIGGIEHGISISTNTHK